MLARQFRSLRPACPLVGFALLSFAGCSSSGTASPAVTHPTMIEVAPEDFLGDVPCSEGPGLKRYVATLIDTDYVAQGGASGVDRATDAEAGGAPMAFQLPSSRPTPCLAGVGFGLVVPGRHYDVKIDGYDTDDLAPRANGSRQMVSPAPAPAAEQPVSALLTPRWSAHCEDAIAIDSTIVRALHCTPFTPLDAGALGSVRVPLSALVGGLVCGDQPGQIDHFEVTLDAGDGVMRVGSVPCAVDAEVVYDELAPRVRVSAYVTAFSVSSGEAFAGATCDAFTLPEASVDADCGALSQVGTLRVDLQALLQQLSLACSASSIATLTVDVPDEDQAQSIAPPECLQPFDHGFAPGPAVVNVTVQPQDASQAPSSRACHAQVLPGRLALAVCDTI
jgi:hypothetical protein